MDALWNANPRLADASRWWHGANSASTGSTAVRTAGHDLAILVGLGILAALATSAGNFGIPLPGHAILRGALPLMLGLSLVPRRSSGIIMSAVAAITFGALRVAGFGPMNIAAVTGLVCLGPALDSALAAAKPGWQLYARAAAAGMAANLAAFAVRFGSASLLGIEGGGRGFLLFWPIALLSFVLLGALAGLLSGVAWFRAQPRSESSP